MFNAYDLAAVVLCLDSNCSFGKMLFAMSESMSMLCLDSNCSFGKMRVRRRIAACELCLDSNCSFGKIAIFAARPLGCFALIPIVLSAK